MTESSLSDAAISPILSFNAGAGNGATLPIVIAVVLAIVLVLAFLIPNREVEQEAVVELAADYPVPPLDLVVPSRPRPRISAGANRGRS